MASLTNVQHIIIFDNRTDIIIFTGYIGKRQQTIDAGNLIGIDLNGRNKFAQCLYQFRIKPCFKYQNLILRSEDFLFIFFQFLGDIAFCIHKCLFADPFLRHLVFVYITYFYIVAEHTVISNLQTRYSRLFAFTLLYLQKKILTRIGYLTQFIQFGIYPVLDNPTFIYQQRRIVIHLFIYPVADGNTKIQLLSYPVQAGIIRLHASRFYRLDRLQGNLQLHYLARRYTPHRHLGNDAFKIAYQMQLFFDQFLKFRLAEKVFHYVQTVINRLLVFQRKHHPTFQHTGTHRTDGFINNIEQTTSTVVHATDKLQAAHGKFIQTHIFVLFNTRQCRDVSDLRMLRHIQVLQNSPGSNDTIFKMLYSETFQILCFKVLQQFLA